MSKDKLIRTPKSRHPAHSTKSWLIPRNLQRRLPLIFTILAIALLGIHLIYSGKAATFATAKEAENGTLAGNATVKTGTNASNGQFVKFGTAQSNPCSSVTPNGFVYAVDGSDPAICNAQGQEIHLSGVDGGGEMDLGEGNSPVNKCTSIWSAPTTADITAMQEIGFNMVRIPVTWANIEPTPPTVQADGTLIHHWNQTYLTALDTYIQELGKAHIMAILDMHQEGWSPYFTSSHPVCGGMGEPNWLYTGTSIATDSGVQDVRNDFFSDKIIGPNDTEKPEEGYNALWSMLAKRYNGNPTVIGADMFNEPNYANSCTDCNLTNFYDNVGATIRAVNPNIILIYEPENKFTKKLNLTNTILSDHNYPATWADGLTAFSGFLATAQSWGLPLWIGETNAMSGDVNPMPTDGNWVQDLQSEMAYFKQNDISWSLWNYDYTGGPYSWSVVTLGSNPPTPKQPLTKDLQCDGDMYGVTIPSNCGN